MKSLEIDCVIISEDNCGLRDALDVPCQDQPLDHLVLTSSSVLGGRYPLLSADVARPISTSFTSLTSLTSAAATAAAAAAAAAAASSRSIFSCLMGCICVNLMRLCRFFIVSEEFNCSPTQQLSSITISLFRIFQLESHFFHHFAS